MPNWNSCTMPVTTPTAKLIRKSLPKNFVSRSQTGSFLISQVVCRHATSSDNPIVSGTKMKWYTVVMANCHLDRSSVLIAMPLRARSLGAFPSRRLVCAGHS